MEDLIDIEKGLNSLASEARLNANKENAQKSTGPHDTAKTKFNAIKHGLLSQRAWKILSDDEKEALENLKREIVEQFTKRPNIFDMIIVEKFLLAYWRVRKANEMHMINSRRDEKSLLKNEFTCFDNDVDIFLKPHTEVPKHLEDGLLKEDLIFARPGGETELIRRYTVSAENEFYRALKELERRISISNSN